MNKMTIMFLVLSLALLCYGAKVYADNKIDTVKTESDATETDSIVKSTIIVTQAVIDSLNGEICSMRSELSSTKSTFTKICYIGLGAILAILLLLVLAFIRIANKVNKKKLQQQFDKFETQIHKIKDDLRGEAKPYSANKAQQQTQQILVEVSKHEIIYDKQKKPFLTIFFKGIRQPFQKEISERDAILAKQNKKTLTEVIEKYFKDEIEKIRTREIKDDPTYKPQNDMRDNPEPNDPSTSTEQQEGQDEGRQHAQKVLYLANNEDDLFIKSFDYKQDNTTFIIEYYPDDGTNKGILKVIGTIDTIKVMNPRSQNYSIKVVKSICTWVEATKYEQINPGVVERYEGSWKIIKPVEIALIK